MGVSLHVIPDPSRLREREEVWNMFMSKCNENPFLLSGFIKQFMAIYRSKGWAPLILVISAEETIVGIAPLMTKKSFGVRFVKFLSKSWFSPDFVIEDRYREACIEIILDFLFNTLRSQFVDLVLPAESPNHRILKQKCEANGIYFCTKRGRWADMGHSIIPITHTWDEFRSSRGRNFRRRFKKVERNLNQAGPWRVVCVEKGNDVSVAFEKILDVERKSWKQAWRTRRGTETDEDLLIIWRGSKHSETEPSFKWGVWFLELNGKTVAYSLVLQYKKSAFIVKTSYDDRYRGFYPGIYVNNFAIRELFDKRQVRRIDWLTDLPFHRNWTNTCLPRVRVMMSPKDIVPATMAFVLASEHARNILHFAPDQLLTTVPLVDQFRIL